MSPKAKEKAKAKAKGKAGAKAASSPKAKSGMKRPAGAAESTPKKRPAVKSDVEDDGDSQRTLALGEEIPEEPRNAKEAKKKKETVDTNKKNDAKEKNAAKEKIAAKEKKEKKGTKETKETPQKKPAKPTEKERKVSNPYFYKNSNIWGVKVDGKEAFAVRFSFAVLVLLYKYGFLSRYFPWSHGLRLVAWSFLQRSLER